MHCPVCTSINTKVIDSRVNADGLGIRRRRECEKCQYRFSTKEEIELLGIVVIKGDGRHESYSREKMQSGIYRSLVKRPYTKERLDRLFNMIERDIQKQRTKEISSKKLGDIVMKHLKKFDKVAYIRFASIYRAFQDVETFHDEVSSLAKPKSKVKRTKKK